MVLNDVFVSICIYRLWPELFELSFTNIVLSVYWLIKVIIWYIGNLVSCVFFSLNVLNNVKEDKQSLSLNFKY